MHSDEIARRDWRTALDTLSRHHYGEVVTVGIESPKVGTHAEVLQLPLVGVSLEDGDAAQSIAIAMGRPADGQITQLIDKPLRLFVERTPADADAGLEVESADHTKTIVRFR
jgi:hypothetical protein